MLCAVECFAPWIALRPCWLRGCLREPFFYSVFSFDVLFYASEAPGGVS